MVEKIKGSILVLALLYTIAIGLIWLVMLLGAEPNDAGFSVTRFPDWLIAASWLFPFTLCFLVAFYITEQDDSFSLRDKKLVYLLGVIVISVPGILGLIYLQNAKEETRASHVTFDSIIQETQRLDIASLPMQVGMPLNGSLLILKKETHTGYTISRDFDSTKLQMASSPEEVGVVVVIIMERKVIREYVNSAPDIQWIFDCHVIDWNSKSVIAHDLFEGGIPSEGGFAHGGHDYGMPPWNEVEQWLVSMTQ
jgi:hypothetical protein